jgi:hypothetical protein
MTYHPAVSQSVKKVADPAAIPKIWTVSAKDHDRAAVTAIVYLEHEGWDPVAGDVVALGGASRLPPPGSPVIVSWSPSRLGGFRPTAIILETELAARKAEAAAATVERMPLRAWLVAVQSVGLLADYTAEGLAGLLTALDRFDDPEADAWDPSTDVDPHSGADILWNIAPQNHGLDREDPEHPLHGVPDDARLPPAALAVHDSGHCARPLAKLVGPVANSVSEGDLDLEDYVARVRRAMIAAGESRLPYLADGAHQSQAYLFLLAPDLASALHARRLLELHT